MGVGVLVGSTPAIGFHGWISVGLATLLRLNRLYAFLGSRVSSPVVLPFIVAAEVELAHRLRCGAYVALDQHDVVGQARGLLLDWCLGAVPIGIALAIVVGSVAYGAAWVRLKRTQLRRQPRSSESPP